MPPWVTKSDVLFVEMKKLRGKPLLSGEVIPHFRYAEFQTSKSGIQDSSENRPGYAVAESLA